MPPQVTVEVDLSERIAGKAALHEAAAGIAERLLSQLVTPAPDEKGRKTRSRPGE
jgi:hypothetical protein